MPIPITSCFSLKKPEEANQILRKLKLIVDVLPLDEKNVGLALNDSDFKDYEDALQYFTALENGSDVLITRNLKDFRKANIPVMTAGQYLQASRKSQLPDYGCTA